MVESGQALSYSMVEGGGRDKSDFRVYSPSNLWAVPSRVRTGGGSSLFDSSTGNSQHEFPPVSGKWCAPEGRFPGLETVKEDKMCDTEQNPAAIPTPLPDNQGDGRWMSLHNHFMMSSKDKEPEVVFIGDSNIQMMHQLEIWRELFSPLHALNFGGIGEGTHHVLWRIVNGELKHIKPKIIVLWVGTYNQGHSAEQIAGGIQAIVDTLEKSQPQAKVIVLSLLPRGKNPNPLRQRNTRVNEMLTNSLPATPNAVLLNIDPGFVHSDGTISHHDLYDYLHLTRQGYARVCLTLQRTLLQLMESRVKTEEP